MKNIEQIGLLLVEDSPDDEAIVCHQLNKDGFEFKEFLRVENEKSFRDALANWKWDLVISDYSLPTFDGMRALRIFKEQKRETPFILVSGTVGEDVAVEALKGGASDYVLKDRLQKLGSVVRKELRAAEERRQSAIREEQLRHSQKLEAIGRLAGGVAHDFNNLLTVITMYCELMEAKVGENNPLSPDIEEIRKATDLAAALTKQLLAFSRKQIFDKKPTDIGSVVEQLSQMLARLVGANIKLSTQIEDALPKCVADVSQIESVIMNLVVNAKDAISGNGRIDICVFKETLDEDKGKLEGGSPGDYVVVSIADTGCGMDKSVMDQIFEPFFTTKDIYKGTGLGLSTAFGIVRQSGGFISVHSELGKGSSFKIYLPALPSELAEWESKAAKLAGNSGEELIKILLVEDQDSLRNVISSSLKNSGYHVQAMSSGDEAIKLIQQGRFRFHLVLTDVVLPEASGTDVTKAVLHFLPEAHVLAMTALMDSNIKELVENSERVHFLQKPFSSQLLLEKVKSITVQGWGNKRTSNLN